MNPLRKNCDPESRWKTAFLRLLSLSFSFYVKSTSTNLPTACHWQIWPTNTVAMLSLSVSRGSRDDYHCCLSSLFKVRTMTRLSRRPFVCSLLVGRESFQHVISDTLKSLSRAVSKGQGFHSMVAICCCHTKKRWSAIQLHFQDKTKGMEKKNI